MYLQLFDLREWAKLFSQISSVRDRMFARVYCYTTQGLIAHFAIVRNLSHHSRNVSGWPSGAAHHVMAGLFQNETAHSRKTVILFTSGPSYFL